MSHGASAGFADIVTPTNIIKVFPELEQPFKAVTGHEVWGLLELTNGCNFDDLADISNELTERLEMDEGEELDDFEKRVDKLGHDFVKKFKDLKKAFTKLTDAELDTQYLDDDSLDGYAEVSGRHWYIYDWKQPKPKVAKAIKKGLKISRSFYAVYG